MYTITEFKETADRSSEKNNTWINIWLKFRNRKVVLDGEMSDPVPVRGATGNSSRPSHAPPLGLHQYS